MWKWSRTTVSGPSYVDAYCPACGNVVHREGSFLHALWWLAFGAGDCDCDEPEPSSEPPAS